jgi:hypothetical protein
MLFPVVLTVGAGWGAYEIYRATRAVRSQTHGIRPPARRNQRLALGLFLLAFAMALYFATASPMLYWDERFTWAFKAKILFHEGTPYSPAFLDPDRFHVWRQYPLLVPTSEAFVARVIGSFDEATIKFIFPCFFFAMLAIFASELRQRTDSTAALMTAGYLAVMPGFLIREPSEAGSYLSGYADLPLAAYALASLALLERFRQEKASGDLVASALCIACTLLTKRDGAIFVAAMGLITAGLVLSKELSWQRLARYWGIVAMGVAPFAYFAAQLPPDVRQPDANYWELLEFARLSQQFSAGEILPRYLATLFGAEWGFVGVFALLALGIGVVRRTALLRRHWALLLYCAVPFGAYLLAFHASPFRATWHLDVSLLRLQSQFVPLWSFAAAVILLERGEGENRFHR